MDRNIICFLLFFSYSTLHFSQVYHCDVKGSLEALRVYETDLTQSIGAQLKVPVHFHDIESRSQTYYHDIIVEVNNRFDGVFKFEVNGSTLIDNASSLPWRNNDYTSKHNIGNVLNIYMVNDIDGPKGMASFPGESNQYVFINQPNFDLPVFDINNLVHEIGHYFGLLHTFSSHFGREEVVDRASAKSTGDLLSDTPAEYNTIAIKEYFSLIEKKLGKSGRILSEQTIVNDGHCQKTSSSKNNLWQYRQSNSPSENWKDFPITDSKGNSYGKIPNNYMSYVTDGCTDHQYYFTNGQKMRMTHYYNEYRKSEFGYQESVVTPGIPTEEDGSSHSEPDYIFKRINTRVISKDETEYDGLYARDVDGYKEVLFNKAIQAHYVYNPHSMAWNYPKLYFLLEAQATQLKSQPQKLMLVGSQFNDEAMNSLKISPLFHFHSYHGHMMHAIKTVWRDGEDIFMPKYETDEREYHEVAFKKRKVSQNQYEVLITGELDKDTPYIIHSNSNFWIFKI